MFFSFQWFAPLDSYSAHKFCLSSQQSTTAYLLAASERL